jgi:dipeptidyl aminopeptidase/acylaminoacyl peptidase
VAKERVRHDAQAATWSPGGRWLVYVTEPGEGAYRVWDSKAGATVDLSLEASGFPTETEGFQDVDWSPEGSHLLFRGRPDKSPGGWVLDLETRRVWQVSDRAVMAASWVDEENILFEARGEGTSEHGPRPSMALGIVDIGPPPKELTETLSLTGGILDVPYALSSDRRYLATLAVSDPRDPRLQLAPLPGHSSLASFAQPLGEDLPVDIMGGTLLWSPDSRWIAFSAQASASPEEKGAYTVLLDTMGLANARGEESQGARSRIFTGFRASGWSPDGRLLTGLACSEVECSLSVIDVVSDQVTTVASAETLQLWDLAWSPTGAYLAYSLAGPDVESTGLMLWDRGTADHLRLMPATGKQPITDLQWTPDSCRLYVAQREDRAESGLPVAVIWGLGPAWEDLWQVAPGSPGTDNPLTESAEASDGDGPKPCPAPPLAGRRLIAYYGTPLGRGLGVLGRNDITTTLRLLNEQAQVYRDLDPDVETVPVFHMVTTIADRYPGDDGDYNHRVPQELIRQWINGVEAVGGWSVLDVQPGRADLDTEWDVVEPLLLERTVHLALDPEFIVSDEEVPGENLGRITGPQVNHIQARLDRIGRAIGHRKMLIVHQFDDRMIQQKAMILDYPFVELVWDADGFGGPGPKIEDYNQYRQEAGFEHGGFKLFYDEDEPLMTPEQVLGLEPPPSVVIYQ